MIWRLLPYAVDAPAYNMAVDEAIFQCYLEGLVPPTLRFYGWDPPALSVGYFQNLAGEVNPANLAAGGFGLVRRPTGGRAVLHHHELTYSVVAGVNHGLPNNLAESYLYISRAFVAAFQHFGITTELHPKTTAEASTTGACFESPSWYELKVARRKLVGSAQLRHNGSFLQHGSILLDFSATDLASVLQLPEELSLERFAERLNQKVTSFRDLGLMIDPVLLANVIVDSFRELYQLEFIEQPLLEAEQRMVQELITGKYANPDWNYTRGKKGRSLKSEVLKG
jgi:lipoate-protein ligase A